MKTNQFCTAKTPISLFAFFFPYCNHILPKYLGHKYLFKLFHVWLSLLTGLFFFINSDDSISGNSLHELKFSLFTRAKCVANSDYQFVVSICFLLLPALQCIITVCKEGQGSGAVDILTISQFASFFSLSIEHKLPVTC